MYNKKSIFYLNSLYAPEIFEKFKSLFWMDS